MKTTKQARCDFPGCKIEAGFRIPLEDEYYCYRHNQSECIRALRVARPEIAVTVTREVDDFATWDEAERGEAQPDGLTPYTFTVEACAIRNGVLYRCESSLGESWCAPDEDVSDIHGYLPQMLDEAVAELDKALTKETK